MAFIHFSRQFEIGKRKRLAVQPEDIKKMNFLFEDTLKEEAIIKKASSAYKIPMCVNHSVKSCCRKCLRKKYKKRGDKFINVRAIYEWTRNLKD